MNITKKVEDKYGDLWNKLAHKLKPKFKIIGHINGFITLYGEEQEIQDFINELDKQM
jgi:hypothetical protein